MLFPNILCLTCVTTKNQPKKWPEETNTANCLLPIRSYVIIFPSSHTSLVSF